MGSKRIICCFSMLFLCYYVNADREDVLGFLLRRTSSCQISMHCSSKYAICFEHRCAENIPCNKDNDCFFYGAADVANGSPHPKCYQGDPTMPAPGYGYCMLEERVGDDSSYTRLKGHDVDSLDVNHVDTHEANKLIKVPKSLRVLSILRRTFLR